MFSKKLKISSNMGYPYRTLLNLNNMILSFNKIRFDHLAMGLPVPNESNDIILIDFSNHTVKETIKGEEQNSLWPYSEISKTRYDGIYQLKVPMGKKLSKGKFVLVEGYSNDWNFKPKGIKEKSIVFYYFYKDNIVKLINRIMSLVS